MKKLIFLLIIPLMMLITSCDSDDPITQTETGNIYITSSPAGAVIWIDGLNTSKTTPDTVTGVDEGARSVTLKLQDYRDTTLTISVNGGQTTVVGPVVLVSDIVITLFGPVKIYETSGTNASQPSGLDLSTGLAHGVISAEANLVDIYYSSAGFLVQSADLYGTLIRETDFLISSGTNLFDQVDSPLRNTGTWTTGIGDRENNYVFLYDHDANYSKLKIVNWGGGNPGDPAWVEVQWYYNTDSQDNRF